jgi:hypothetical protein
MAQRTIVEFDLDRADIERNHDERHPNIPDRST